MKLVDNRHSKCLALIGVWVRFPPSALLVVKEQVRKAEGHRWRRCNGFIAHHRFESCLLRWDCGRDAARRLRIWPFGVRNGTIPRVRPGGRRFDSFRSHQGAGLERRRPELELQEWVTPSWGQIPPAPLDLDAEVVQLAGDNPLKTGSVRVRLPPSALLTSLPSNLFLTFCRCPKYGTFVE